MAISTYTDLLEAVNTWLARADMTAVAPDFVTLAENRIYSEMRVRHMEAQVSATVSAGSIDVPSGYLEAKTLYVAGTPVQWLEMRDPEWIYQMYPLRGSDGKPQFVAREQGKFIFGPYPDSAYLIQGTYYQRLDALSTASPTNWLTSEGQDLVLFGALVESAPFLGADQRIPVWEGRFREARDRLQSQHDRERWPAEMAIRAVTG